MHIIRAFVVCFLWSLSILSVILLVHITKIWYIITIYIYIYIKNIESRHGSNFFGIGGTNGSRNGNFQCHRCHESTSWRILIFSVYIWCDILLTHWNRVKMEIVLQTTFSNTYFSRKTMCILIAKFVLQCPIYNGPALLQITVRRRIGASH